MSRLFLVLLVACQRTVVGVEEAPSEPVVAEPLTQGLTETEINRLAHMPLGCEKIPYNWLMALRDAKGAPLLADPARFGLIPDPRDPFGLPIGLAAVTPVGLTTRMVGPTCIACHMGEVRYAGKSVRVIGGASRFQFFGFQKAVIETLAATVGDPQLLAAFMDRVKEVDRAFPPDVVGEASSSALVTSGATRLSAEINAVTSDPGPGRLDAIGFTLQILYPGKAPRADAAVSFPEVWDSARTPWFHYDGSTNTIAQRNAAPPLGIGVLFEPSTFFSTLLTRNAFEAELSFWKLEPPAWPSEMIAPLDETKRTRGSELYARECASCHETNVFALIEPSDIGTDTARLETMTIEVDGKPAILGMASVLASLVDAAYEREHVTTSERERARFGHSGEETWRVTGRYKTPSLRGVWSTAPYLHNGSVPTLHDLLRPAAERPKSFLVGSPDFDPLHVGYVTLPGDPLVYVYDTTLKGNGNGGHEYGTTLNDDDRFALIEFLKSL